MSHHLVIAEDLFFQYPDGTHALNGVSFEIHHGESVGLIGPNGAGKSTLLNHLNGFFLPTKGRMRIGDVVITRKTRKTIRKSIGIVFQNPDDQLFMSRIQDDVAFGPRNMGLPDEVVAERVSAALGLLNIGNLGHRAPHHLSDGQKRAAAIATVLAMKPDVLVMDEPSSNLDSGSRRKIINFLNAFEHTRIVVSHDLDFIWDTCKRTILLNKGCVEAAGETKVLLKNQALLESCGLELPLRFQGE